MNRKHLCAAIAAFMCATLQARTQTTQEYKGPIIDAHAHLRLGEDDGLTPTQPVGTDALRTLDTTAGVAKSALIVIARQGQLEKTRQQNDAVIAAATASPNHFYPVVSLHPADKQAALDELNRVAKLGAKEVKLHPNTQNFDVSDPDVGTVVEKCGELNLVVLFDSYKPWDASEMGKFLLLAVQHPKTKIVLAHMGFFLLPRSRLLRTHPDASGMADNSSGSTYPPSPPPTPVHLSNPNLSGRCAKSARTYILFGSDWPVYTPDEAVKAVRSLGLTVDEQKQIFHDNAVQLLGLEKPVPAH